jgi:serine/threonine protein kinase
MSGTPLYMSPESIQTPDMIDARSDIYAVGAVGYFLLTGNTVFNATSLSELCQQHLSVLPETPSQRLGRTVSPELEHAILACLEKSRAKRPQTARDLSAMLERVTNAQPWTLDDAEAWWSRHERSLKSGTGFSLSGVGQSPGTTGSGANSADPKLSQPPATVTPGLDQTACFPPPEH